MKKNSKKHLRNIFKITLNFLTRPILPHITVLDSETDGRQTVFVEMLLFDTLPKPVYKLQLRALEHSERVRNILET